MAVGLAVGRVELRMLMALQVEIDVLAPLQVLNSNFEESTEVIGLKVAVAA